jgi:glycosyltransferase involved in cell wall biosynthesis
VKITLVGPTFPFKGGVAQHTTELAKRLANDRHEVRILTWNAQYPKRLYPGRLEASEPEGMPFDRVERRLNWYNPIGWWRAGRALRGPDHLAVICMITAIQVPAYLMLVAAARRAGATPVVICHNVIPHDAGRWQQWLNGLLYRRVGPTLVHSDREAALADGLGADPIAVAELPFFFPVEIPRVVQRDAPAHRLLFFGFVRPYKGLDVLIEALARTEHDISLLAVGEFWDPIEKYRSQVERLGLSTRVTLEDRYFAADEIPGLFAGVDALVVPYRSGTGSQHPDIGHLAGVPVIASDVGDLAGAIDDEIDGVVCPPDNPAALAHAIDSLYRPGVLSAMSAAAAGPDVDAQWSTYTSALLRLADQRG